MSLASDHHTLIETLRLSVAIRILDLDGMNPRVRERILAQWAEQAVDIVACKGDVLQFRSRRGESAEAFNALARGLTALAYQPGGVDFAGVHFCADHQLCLDAAAESAARPSLLDVDQAEPEPTGPTVLGRPVVDVHLPDGD